MTSFRVGGQDGVSWPQRSPLILSGMTRHYGLCLDIAEGDAAATEPAHFERDDSVAVRGETKRQALAATEPAHFERDDYELETIPGRE